ncbi:hypothetical protein H5P36_06960 [Bacillus sp. APMAM]|nr:hypothetical protein [Bacillus sp. APMAM]RTZ56618.1 hypothetical protein EKO25_06615 [Bacillus sp. SAJ1]
MAKIKSFFRKDIDLALYVGALFCLILGIYKLFLTSGSDIYGFILVFLAVIGLIANFVDKMQEKKKNKKA